jgi:hypothetical protein
MIIKDTLNKMLLKKAVASKDLEQILKNAEALSQTGQHQSEIDNLAEIIINSNDAYYIYHFAERVEGAPVLNLAQAIIATGNQDYIYCFARYVKQAPVEILAQAVIKTADSSSIYMFAKDVKNVNIELMMKAIVDINDAKWIYLFARDVKGASIEELATTIVSTQNISWILKFATTIPGAMTIITEKIVATKNSKLMYDLAINIMSIENAPIDILLSGVISSGNPQHIYNFIKNVQGVQQNQIPEDILNKIKVIDKILADHEAEAKAEVKAEIKEIANQPKKLVKH